MTDTFSSPLSDDESRELAERLGFLCVELGRGQLEGMLAEAGAEDLLEEAVTLVAVPGPAQPRLVQVLDAIDDALLAVGVHNLTRGNRSWHPLPGVPGPRPALTVQICPLARCLRSEAGAEPARCALGDRPLSTVPLDP